MSKILLSTQTGDLITDGESARKYFPILAASGFEAVDFGFNAVVIQENIRKKLPLRVLDLPKEEMLDYFREIKAAADESGIVFGQTHAHYQTLLPSDDKEYNKYLYECLLKEIEITALFSCPKIVIHPVFSGIPGAWSEEYVKELTFEVFESLIPTLKKYNITACLENMWYADKGKIYGAACSNWSTVSLWIDELNQLAGCELFGFCFDTGHAVLTGSDPVNGITALKGKIAAVHLHDNDGLHDSHTLPFSGISNWDRIMKALVNIGYSGALNFEAQNAWKMFPEPLYGDAIKLLGTVGRYFIDTYFNE
ncbi:MAG: sugar phosphate isomerase/epimerase [Clostridiales bacterium]|nr:sugar phosphate isomerase/epimerase [Candidatus Equinaster intestinalis]